MPRRSSSIDLTLDDDSEASDLAGITPASFDEPEERPARTERKPLSKEASIRALARTYQGAHRIGAKLLEEPQLEIDDSEAREFGKATYDLLKVYGKDLAAHPKAAAWIAWALTVLEIDGPRFALIATRPPRDRRNEPEQGEPPPFVLPQTGDWAAYQP